MSPYSSWGSSCEKFEDVEAFLHPHPRKGAVRERLFASNWGPLLAAAEHHAPVLRRCYLIASEESAPQAAALDSLIKQVAGDHVEVRLMPKAGVSPTDIALTAFYVHQAYEDARTDGFMPNALIADFSGGTSAMTAGMILATLEVDRKLECIRQHPERNHSHLLTPAGTPKSKEQLLADKVLVEVRTIPQDAPAYRATRRELNARVQATEGAADRSEGPPATPTAPRS